MHYNFINIYQTMRTVQLFLTFLTIFLTPKNAYGLCTFSHSLSLLLAMYLVLNLLQCVLHWFNEITG